MICCDELGFPYWSWSIAIILKIILDVCTVQRWEQTDKNGKTYKYIDRDCSDEKAAKEKAGKKNCNDVKIDLTGDKFEACWSICEGNLCNDARAVFGSMILMALMMI